MSSLLPDERGLMTKNYVESHSFNSLQLWPSQVVLVVKKLPTNTGNLRYAASIPGWEDPLEKGMATHSSISASRIPWTEEPGGLQSMRSQRVGQD